MKKEFNDLLIDVHSSSNPQSEITIAQCPPEQGLRHLCGFLSVYKNKDGAVKPKCDVDGFICNHVVIKEEIKK